jgi:flagellar biosynthesis/type III secretory pathway M-ring protein FliF/YscJ
VAFFVYLHKTNQNMIYYIIILIAVIFIIIQALLIVAYRKSEKALYQIISEKDTHLGMMDKILQERTKYTESLLKDNCNVKKQLIHSKRMIESLRRKNLINKTT